MNKQIRTLSIFLAVLIAATVTLISCSNMLTDLKENPAGTALTDAESVTADTVSLTAASILGTNTALTAVTTNLTLPDSGTNGTTITWSSATPGTISNAGVVTRPAAGSGDVTVTMTATITKGSETATKNFTVTVNEAEPVGDYFVSKAGNDTTGTGTMANPFLTISKAIDTASGTKAIFVSAGTYNEQITTKLGISLYGGFSADFSSRNITDRTDTNTTYQTKITWSATAGSGTVKIDTTTLVSSIIEGFYINYDGGNLNAAVTVDGSVTLNKCTIIGLNHATNGDSYSIYMRGMTSGSIGNSLIQNCEISSDCGRTLRIVKNTADLNSPVIKNNIFKRIPLAAGVTTQYQIEVAYATTPTIDGNTIEGGAATSGNYGIMVGNNAGTGANIKNNIIHLGYGAGSGETGIYYSGTATGYTIENNTITYDGSASYAYATGIRIHDCSGITVRNNIIKSLMGTTTNSGIEMTGSITNVNIKLFNNVINIVGPGSISNTGMQIRETGTAGTVLAINNSVYINAGTSATGIKLPSGSPVVQNNICVLNIAGKGVEKAGTPTFEYNCIYVNGADSGWDLAATTGNVKVDPILTVGADLTLSATTPATVSAGGTNLYGSNSNALDTDIIGAARPSSEAWAMGAYNPN